MPGEDPDDGEEAGHDRLDDQVARHAPMPRDAGRPGSSVRTGAHSTKPDNEHQQLDGHPGGARYCAARFTAPTVSVPTATTVTMATAGAGRTATRSTASTAAGRVRRAMDGAGCAEDQEGRHGQGEQQPLEHESQEQPVAGQVAQRPGERPRQEDEATEEEDLLAPCRPRRTPVAASPTGSAPPGASSGEEPEHVEVPVEGMAGGDHRPSLAVGSRRWRPPRSSIGWSASPIWSWCCSTRASR